MGSKVTVLVPDKLYAVSHPYELDGIITTHPATAQGYAPIQSYVLREGDRALLVGTGLGVHQDEMLEDLAPLVEGARLSLMPLGLDFARISNARPIADRFGLEYVYQPEYSNAPRWWLNFRPEFPTDERDGLRAAKSAPLRIGEPIFLGAGDRRRLELLVPPLRLLPHPWLYDHETRALFTVDVFGWVWRPAAQRPWVVETGAEDWTTEETVRDHLVHTRYWWLPGGRTERLRTMLADLFDRYDIEIIAPDTGCVLKGAETVARHRGLLDRVLEKAPDEDSIGVAVGQWQFGGQP